MCLRDDSRENVLDIPGGGDLIGAPARSANAACPPFRNSGCRRRAPAGMRVAVNDNRPRAAVGDQTTFSPPRKLATTATTAPGTCNHGNAAIKTARAGREQVPVAVRCVASKKRSDLRLPPWGTSWAKWSTKLNVTTSNSDRPKMAADPVPECVSGAEALRYASTFVENRFENRPRCLSTPAKRAFDQAQ